MKERRERWFRRSPAGEAQDCLRPGHRAPRFRSDNDLYLWRAWLIFAVPMTGMVLGGFMAFDVPFRYSPAATFPAVSLLIFFRLSAWRNRRLGRRFSHYDPDDLEP